MKLWDYFMVLLELFLNLFKRDNSAVNAKPLEDYINQRSSELIFECLLYSVLDVGAYTDHEQGPIHVTTGNWVKYVHDNHYRHKLKEENPEKCWEAIPKCHLDYFLTPNKLIEILRDRNDEYSPKAVFVEAFLYEHGLYFDKDTDKANDLYDECRELAKQNNPDGQEAMVEFAEKVKAGRMKIWRDFSYDQCEMLVWTYWYALEEENEEYADLRKLFVGCNSMGKYYLQRLTAIAVGKYADTHANVVHPMSIALLGSAFTSYHPVLDHINGLLSKSEREKFQKRLLNNCIYIDREGGPESKYTDALLRYLELKKGSVCEFIY